MADQLPREAVEALLALRRAQAEAPGAALSVRFAAGNEHGEITTQRRVGSAAPNFSAWVELGMHAVEESDYRSTRLAAIDALLAQLDIEVPPSLRDRAAQIIEAAFRAGYDTGHDDGLDCERREGNCTCSHVGEWERIRADLVGGLDSSEVSRG